MDVNQIYCDISQYKQILNPYVYTWIECCKSIVRQKKIKM